MWLVFKACFVLSWLTFSCSNCSSGKWIRGDDSFLSEISANISFGRGYKERNPKDWLNGSCSVSDASYSCYFQGHPITEELQRREFVADDPQQCLPLSREKFFELIQNRKLLFVGDSITRQVWTNVVCMLEGHNGSLLSSLTMATRYSHADIDASWKHHHPPFAGTAVFEKYRAIVEMAIISMSWSWPPIVWRHYLQHASAKHDIIVFNLGAHYNAESHYRSMLQPIREVFDSIALDKNLTARLPTILFMESLPQHFDSDDGNYHPKATKILSRKKFNHILNATKDDLHCKPHRHRNDWRNRIAHEVFGPSNDTADSHFDHQLNITFIPTASALNSQYDMHPDISSYYGLDCTHYCPEGGASRYIIRSLMNTIHSLHLPPVIDDEFIAALPMRKHGLLIRPQIGKSVALVTNSTKRAIMSGQVIDKRGYDWSAIMTVETTAWENMSQGENISD